MKWVLLNKTHVNTDHLDAFRWEDGDLLINYGMDSATYRFDDPDRRLYLMLCHRLGVIPFEEIADGK